MIHNLGQALESYIDKWFKPAAYALILLRNSGYPCVFYGDFYGIEHNKIDPIGELKDLIRLRKDKAYGTQNDYFDNNNIVGWTREGDEEHLQSGLAVVISNAGDGENRMYIWTKFTGCKFIDAIGYCQDEIIIEESGWANFKVKARSVSVWVSC